MAVADLLIGLTGSWEPTGIYSFEFRTKDDVKIAEIPFLLPPDSVEVTEPQRSTLSPTLFGGFITDFGADFKKIRVTGMTHFFYSGTTRGTKSYGRTSTTAPEDFIDGYTEFRKLRYMLSRYRDYTFTSNGKQKIEDFSLPALGEVNALKSKVDDLIDSGDGALADQIKMIWHDYDYDDHYLVKIDEFGVPRDKGDPGSVTYNIDMMGYEVDNRDSTAQQTTPTLKKVTAPEQIRRTLIVMGAEHEATKPEELPVVTPAGIVSVPNEQASSSATASSVISL